MRREDMHGEVWMRFPEFRQELLRVRFVDVVPERPAAVQCGLDVSGV